MLRKLQIHPSTEADYFAELEFSFDQELKDWVKKLPGTAWISSSKRWRVASEMTRLVSDRFLSLDYSVVDLRSPPKTKDWELGEYLFPWQHAAVQRALNSGQVPRWIFGDDTGIGKSIQAIAALQALNATNILIVCPAGVRLDWKAKIERFWPSRAKSSGLIWATKNRKNITKTKQKDLDQAFGAEIQIVSPELVSYLDTLSWNAIIIDEAHITKNPLSQISFQLKDVFARNIHTPAFALTATPMPDKPEDIWSLLDILWPGRFGKRNKNGNGSFQFKERYLRRTTTDEGYLIYEGTRHEDEFKERLAAVSSRHSKQNPEISKYLPPFSVSALRISPSDRFTGLGFDVVSSEDLERSLHVFGSEKLRPTIDWVRNAVEEVSHVCVMSHRRGLASEIYKGLQELSDNTGAVLVHLDGGTSAGDRAKKIDLCRLADKGIIVATMQSVGIGIDLTFCQKALISELDYRPEKILQAVGRFSRISGTVPSEVQIMLLEGTVDELVAEALLSKFEDINAVWNQNSKVSSALELGGQDEEDFVASLVRASQAFGKSDYEDSAEL